MNRPGMSGWQVGDGASFAAGGATTAEDRQAARGQWAFWAALMLLTAGVYALLNNGSWLSGGSDAAYYLSIARNLARGEGLTWHGEPVLTAAPGWPWLLSLVMRATDSLGAINALSGGLIVGATGLWYWVLRRYASPKLSFLLMLLVAALYHWFRGAMLAYSEPPFCFLTAAALLLALQIGDGRGLRWRVPLFLGCCAGLVLTRWAGVLLFPVLAGALLSGWLRDWRRWALVAACGLVLGGLGGGVKASLHAQARARGAIEALSAEQRLMDRRFSPTPQLIAQRLGNGGMWVSALLWPETEMLRLEGLAAWGPRLAGWAALLVFVAHAVRAGHRHQWLWLGTLLYCVVIFAMVTRVTGRYLLPVAPVLLLGMWEGLRALPLLAGRPRALRMAATALFGSVAACNAPLLAVSVAVVQLPGFQARYLAGEHQEFCSVAAWLMDEGAADGEIAVNTSHPRERIREERFLARMINWLADVEVAPVPPEVCTGAPNDALADWARQHNVRFYLMRSEEQPRRLWHWRLGQGERTYLEVYALRDGQLEPVRPPARTEGIRRVPGL
jgi:hypothetical protein